VFAQAQAADPGAAAGAKSAAVKLEPIPGSAAKRVRLSAKAAERLGIEMGKVEEQPIVRKQMVSGLVMTSQEVAAAPKLAFGGSGGGGQPEGRPVRRAVLRRARRGLGLRQQGAARIRAAKRSGRSRGGQRGGAYGRTRARHFGRDGGRRAALRRGDFWQMSFGK